MTGVVLSSLQKHVVAIGKAAGRVIIGDVLRFYSTQEAVKKCMERLVLIGLFKAPKDFGIWEYNLENDALAIEALSAESSQEA